METISKKQNTQLLIITHGDNSNKVWRNFNFSCYIQYKYIPCSFGSMTQVFMEANMTLDSYYTVNKNSDSQRILATGFILIWLTFQHFHELEQPVCQ